MNVFDEDRDQVVQRAKRHGVIAIVNPTINSEDFVKAVRIREQYREILHIALGLAPQRATKTDLMKVLELARNYRNEFIAIGECGLDFYWVRDINEIKLMREIFRSMLQLAVEYRLPVIIHARTAFGHNAYREVMRLLEEYGVEDAVFHAFLGSKADMREITKRGWYISFPTVYVRRKDLWGIIMEAPIDYILIETDSPYLAPQKGIRNEPANVVMLVELIARLKNMDKFDVADIILRNTRDLFRIQI